MTNNKVLVFVIAALAEFFLATQHSTADSFLGAKQVIAEGPVYDPVPSMPDLNPPEGIPIKVFSSQPLQVHAIIPDRGRPGDHIRLEGTNFSEVPSENTVLFLTGKAEVLSASSNVLEVVVPANGGSGPVTVQINQQVSQPLYFEYISEPLSAPIKVFWRTGFD